MTIDNAIASPGCDRRDILHSLIGIDEAIDRIAAHVTPVVQTEVVSTGSAVGRVLAEPVRCRSAEPSFDNAAMDGYAIATSALTGGGPWELQVVTRVAAGQETTTSVKGAVAARIFTGAQIPDGVDTVVPQEEVQRDGSLIRLCRRPAADMNIRRAGSDMAEGAIALEKGCRLGPKEIAACAAAGVGILRVRRRLRVALLVTGDEVCRAAGPRKSAKIWDVNTPMLTASLSSIGVELVVIAHGADSLSGLADQIGDMSAQADLVVTTGGISVGEEDHVKPAVRALGGETFFSGVAIKPGKPVTVGRIGKAHWLGLPGNPVSAFVTLQVFGLALIHNLTGERTGAPTRRQVVAAREIRRKRGRCELRPATLAGFDTDGREVASFEDATHSARVGLLAQADGLIFLPADLESLPAGAVVEFQPFCQS